MKKRIKALFMLIIFALLTIFGNRSFALSEETVSNVSIILDINAIDTMSGLDKMMISNYSDFRDGVWEPYAEQKQWTLLSDKAINYVYIKIKDMYNNSSEPYKITIDLGDRNVLKDIEIDVKAQITNDPKVKVILPKDETLKKMSFSFDDQKWMDWEDYKNLKELTLGGGDGKKSIYVSIKDEDDFVFTKGFKDFVTLDTVKPNFGDIKITPENEKSKEVQVKTNFAYDLSGISVKKYAAGNRDASYFKENGTVFEGDSIKLTENGIYTIYMMDAAGNESIITFDVTNIDKSSEVTKPTDNTKPMDNNSSNNNGSISTTATATDNTQGGSSIKGITSDSQNENTQKPDKNVGTTLPADNTKHSIGKNEGTGEVSGGMRFLPSSGKSILNDNLPTGPIIDLNIDISLNSKVGGQTATAIAKGLKPFSQVKIVVYPESRVLAIGNADASGNVVMTGIFPEDLSAEQYTVMAVGVGNQGQEVQTIGGFKLSASGTVTAFANPGQVIRPLQPNNPRLIRAVDAGKPLYDVARYPGVVATIMVTITSFLGLAGAGGLNRSVDVRSSNTKKSKGKLAGVATKKLKALKSSEFAWGDVHKTWAFPGTATTDLWGSTIPNKVGKFSAIVPRVLVDGSWSRAMFGAGGYILWIVGAILGIISAYSVNFMALPPALPIVLVIVALSILDSAAGAIAWIIITSCTIATGNVTVWADVRTLLGMFVLFSSLPMLAHVIRPLRRRVNGDYKEIFDRAADYIMPPVSLAFAASSMVKALNGLSGLQLFTPDHYNKVRLIVGVVFILRMVLEDITTYLYPIRSAKVQAEKLVSPGKRVQWISVVMRVGVFVLIAEPFVGLGWLTCLAAILTAIPKATKIYEDSLPNFKLLHKWFPRGNLNFTILMIVGIYLSSWLLKQGSGDDWARQTYVILLLPGFIASCIEYFAREGGHWPDSWLKRLMGTGVWIFSMSIVLGVISLV